jgi:cytochrome c peroxidase
MLQTEPYRSLRAFLAMIRSAASPFQFGWQQSLGYFAALFALIFSTLTLGAAAGPGLHQVTWSASEVGHEIFTFSNSIVGAQPTMNDFQWGYLVIEAAHSLDLTQPGKVSWYDFSNPRSPTLLFQGAGANNKPHVIAFYRDRMMDGYQGKSFHIWDFLNKTIVNTYSGSVDPVWYMCQFPYVFRPRNGYGTGDNLMEVADMTAGNGAELALFDLGSVLSFAVGSSHAVGNLLICSASQAKGVAVFDISDPGNPRLLSQLVTGNPVYTSMVHSNRVYQCETTSGIRVYDFSDPYNVKLAGFVPVPDNPRYVILRDGKGYCCPGSAKLVVFDATTLAIQQTYTLGGVADFAQVIGNMVITGGHEAAQRCSIVPIQQAPDTNGPVVQFANPPNGAQSQALTSRIGFIMSDHIDVTSMDTNTFIVRPLGGAAIPGTYSTQLGMINFAPDQPLAPATTYEVILPAGGIRDVVGNGLARAFSLQFTTLNATNSGGPDGTAGHWRFNNTNTDESGYNRPAQLLNGAAYSTNSAEGAASVALDGVNDFVNVGAITLSNQFTLALWARLASGTTNIQSLAANSIGGFSANGFRFFVNTYQTANRRLLLETGNGTNGLSFSSNTNVFALDQWNHVALVVDRAAGTALIYYNGAQVASGSVRTDFATAGAIDFGAMIGPTLPFRGNLDDVRIYNRALSTNEITALAAPNLPPVLLSFTGSPAAPLVGQSSVFSATASDPNSGDTLQYSFTFGDGTPPTAFATNTSAQHVYALPGRYSASVRVTDGIASVSTNALVIAHYAPTAPAAAASAQILYDASRARVWCANRDSDTVSRMNAGTFAKDFELAVGAGPRSIALQPDASALWVVCEKADELRVLDASSGVLLTQTNLGYGVAPVAIAFAPNGSAAFVAGEGSHSLLRLDVPSRAVTGSLVLGAKPGSIALSGNSSRLLASRFISPDQEGEVWEVNPSTMSLTRTFSLAFDNTPDGENSGRGVPNYLMQAAITPDGRSAWVPSKKDNIARGLYRDGQRLTHDNTVRSILSQLDLVANTETLSNRIDVDNHSVPGSICFSPLGDLAYVTYQANNEVRVFDTATGNTLSAASTGLAPQDLCLSPDGTRLFVLNFLSRSISIFDVSQLAAGKSSAITFLVETNMATAEKLAAQVLAGKRIFYNAADPRMANEGYLTCATCHLDGKEDGRVWDFTDRGEGLRRTITMQGRRGMGHGRVHWSANFDEIQDFEHDMRNAFGGTGFMSDADFNTGTRNTPLGDPKAGISPELDALAAYVSSLVDYPKSTARTGGALTSPAANGRAHFLDLQCFTCHGGPDFTDSAYGELHDVGTLKPGSGQRLGGVLMGIDTPTLRGISSTAPYLHDGSAGDLAAVFAATNAPAGSPHAAVRTLSPVQQNELLEFLAELDGAEPAVPPASPKLQVAPGLTSVVLQWPTAASDFSLLSTTNLTLPVTWNVITNAPQTNGSFLQTVLPLDGRQRFFLLESR